jgi:hypothetical protein
VRGLQGQRAIVLLGAVSARAALGQQVGGQHASWRGALGRCGRHQPLDHLLELGCEGGHQHQLALPDLLVSAATCTHATQPLILTCPVRAGALHHQSLRSLSEGSRPEGRWVPVASSYREAPSMNMSALSRARKSSFSTSWGMYLHHTAAPLTGTSTLS